MKSSTPHATSPGSVERWENEGGQTKPSTATGIDDLQVELKRYGISPVHLTVFDWGGYRYSNASDAIAAAKRLSRFA
jgi:hypothetical protein